MRLLQSLPRQKRPKLFIRRVAGGSMRPGYMPGRIIIAVPLWRSVRVGDVVLVRHQGSDIVKRVAQVRTDQLYILGDSPLVSTDSRTFGWIDNAVVCGVVVWPLPRTAALAHTRQR